MGYRFLFASWSHSNMGLYNDYFYNEWPSELLEETLDLDYETRAKSGMTPEAQIDRMAHLYGEAFKKKPPWEY